jgi:hypothetical protein
MQKIHIFVGSSIKEFAFERKKLMVTAQLLNQMIKGNGLDSKISLEMCEFEDYVIKEKGTQEYINNKILECDISIFIFDQVFGQYTKEELLFTHINKDKNKYPIYVFKSSCSSRIVEENLDILMKQLTNIEIINFSSIGELIYGVIKILNTEFFKLPLEYKDEVIYFNNRSFE